MRTENEWVDVVWIVKCNERGRGRRRRRGGREGRRRRDGGSTEKTRTPLRKWGKI